MLGFGRRRAKMAGALLAAGVASWAGVAGAQGLSLPNLNNPFAGVDDQRSELPDRGHMSRTSVAIFDYDHTWGGTEIEGGPMWWRRVGTNSTHEGWELSLGAVTETRIGQVFLAGAVRLDFRAFDSQSYAVTPLQNMALVGVRLGPFEPESRVGFSLITLDAFHSQWSFEMFSPRVEGGFALRFGRLRFGAHAFSEYLWRWWGDSYFEKGIAFEIRLEATKKKSPLDP
jgi:hypothetical protein